MIYELGFLVDKSKESLLDELRRVAKLLEKETLTQADLDQHGRARSSTIKKRFGTWNTALEEAGLRVGKRMEVSEEFIFAEIGRIWSLIGHQPTREEFIENSDLSTGPLRRGFGGYQKALAAFCDQQKQNRPEQTVPSSSNREELRSELTSSNKRRRSRRYGELINLQGMLHAPVNEQGVVFLFAILAEKLGYKVEAIASAFPDCEAKRFNKTGSFWEKVDIEFEYKSSEFRRHGHDSEKCDVIVCWINDWKDCPLEVLELSRKVKEFSDRA